jgi:hypothetical protein
MMTPQQISEKLVTEKDRIWRELDRQYQLPIPTPRADRESLDSDFEDEFAHITCEAELDSALKSYRAAAERRVSSLAEYVLDLRQRDLLGASAPRRPVAGSRRGGTRQESRDRRYLRVLAFVTQREVPLRRLLRRSLKTDGRRISWKRLAAEWKKAYPKERLSAETLRRYYYRARADRHLRQRHFDTFLGEWRKWAEKAAPVLDMLKASGCRKDDLFVEFAEGDGTKLAESMEHVPGLAGLASQVRRVKGRGKISLKLQSEQTSALQRAALRKCGLAAGFIKWSRGTDFCTGPQCHRCKVGTDLLGMGMVAQEDLSAASAAEAVEKLKRDLRFTALLFGARRDQQTTDRQQGDP